jgi:hypothetical protein
MTTSGELAGEAAVQGHALPWCVALETAAPDAARPFLRKAAWLILAALPELKVPVLVVGRTYTALREHGRIALVPAEVQAAIAARYPELEQRAKTFLA